MSERLPPPPQGRCQRPASLQPAQDAEVGGAPEPGVGVAGREGPDGLPEGIKGREPYSTPHRLHPETLPGAPGMPHLPIPQLGPISAPPPRQSWPAPVSLLRAARMSPGRVLGRTCSRWLTVGLGERTRRSESSALPLGKPRDAWERLVCRTERRRMQLGQLPQGGARSVQQAPPQTVPGSLRTLAGLTNEPSQQRRTEACPRCTCTRQKRGKTNSEAE